MSRFASLLAASVVLSATAPPGGAQVFHVTAPAIPGATHAELVALSSDGTAAVGRFWLNGVSQAFRWTAEEGSVHIAANVSSPATMEPSCCSGGGLVIFGFGELSGDLGPWRWTAESSVQAMIPGGGIVVHTSVSEDGLATAGFRFGDNGVNSFRWNQSFGFQTLPPTPGPNPIASDISSDGSTVVGTFGGGGGATFLWRENSGIVILPMNALTEHRPSVSYDGSFVVGNDNRFACRYTVASEELMFFNGSDGNPIRGNAVGVSADGAAVLIDSKPVCLWTAKNGLETLSVPLFAVGMSDDGAVIAGRTWVRWLRPPSPYTYPPCRGDLTEDATIGLHDLVKALSEFRQEGDGLIADITGDGVVDWLDLNIVLTEFGETCE